MTDKKILCRMALESGADCSAVISVSDISFNREFRTACEKNICGRFGACWMCPPDVGDIDAMIENAKTYKKALVFQTISNIEDSFDIEGMQDAAKRHNAVSQKLAGLVLPLLGDSLKLGAGACHVCEKCAKADNEPCRHPDKALASLEAYGINVSELAAASKMKYNNGPNTVTYFGGFLYRE